MSTQSFTPDASSHRDDSEATEVAEAPAKPSKSQIKRELLAITALAKTLSGLSKDQIKQLPITEQMQDSLLEAQRLKSHEAKRRQIHYAGKLLRHADIASIEAQLAVWHGGGATAADDALHRTNLWRDRLVQSDEAVTDFVSQYPDIDIQALRSHIRQARREQQRLAENTTNEQDTRQHYRALFQFLKPWIE